MTRKLNTGGVSILVRVIQNLLLGACLLSGSTMADSLKVIVPGSTPLESLTRKEVADYFLDRPGVKIDSLKPLDRDELALKSLFYEEIVNMSPNRLRAYWAKMVFTSRGRPPQTISDKDLPELKDQKVITYTRSANIPEGMKVVLDIPLKN